MHNGNNIVIRDALFILHRRGRRILSLANGVYLNYRRHPKQKRNSHLLIHKQYATQNPK